MGSHLKYLFLGTWIMLLLHVLFFSCGREKGHDESDFLADSLNKISFAYRYKNLVTSSEAAEEALQLDPQNPTVRAQVLNNLGFCAFMEMDFEKAIHYYKTVSRETNNEIEGLISDVGIMKICQRTSLNKEFFDYRNSALRRMKRIGADDMVKTDSALVSRYNYALSEFYIVSGIYYYYLQQDRESLQSIDAISEQSLSGDTAQWLYYMYMRGSGGMYQASTPEAQLIGEFGYLMECLEKAHLYKYTYFEANALQAMAEMLNFEANRDLLEGRRLTWLRMINPTELDLDSLPLALAHRALDLFKEYGDWYQISGTYRTIATYYNHINKPELALQNLKKAVEYVNMHHAKYYACNDTLDRLLTYRDDIPFSVELVWVNDQGIKTVPEWIARLREQLSRTYSAMGMKIESDYNRNIYLDLLDYTRQDKELESRYATLETESRQLNVLLFLVGLVFIVLLIVFIYLNRFWKKSYSLYLEELRNVLDLCQKITAAVPQQASERDDVIDAVLNIVGDDILSLVEAEQLWISWMDDDLDLKPSWTQNENTVTFELIAPGKVHPVATLWMYKEAGLRKDEFTLLQIIMPYIAWTLENGLNLASLSDERLRLEKEQYIHLQHLIENKRQNEVKKTCLSIVTGIVPYIDRVVNEIQKLQKEKFSKDEQIKRGKLHYISELSGKINEYNDILAEWIKMRQGALNLNIENFELNDLFKVIAKGRRTFEMKHQQLLLEDTSVVVKADKALTLFMINTLTENARKYVHQGGYVKVYAEETENYIEVSVADNGPGLSEKDVQRILSEKVYDSGAIGMETTSDAEQLQKQKGHGFGLMNCKGIIDKYKKTNPLFAVCLFSIESELGKGSRFFFRLPKGVQRVVHVLVPFFFLMTSCFISCNGNETEKVVLQKEVENLDSVTVNSDSVSALSEESKSMDSGYVLTPYDSLLAIANQYANEVYEANVDHRYNKALELADSVLYYLNAHYLRYAGVAGPLLRMQGKGEAAELVWLSEHFDTDYFILLDVRNEIAVASLAIKDFERYYYNNLAYTTLYKQISEDNSLEGYCVKMQRSSNNKSIALTLFVVMSIGFFVAYYLLYWRRRLHYRYNLEQVFAINRAAFSATAVAQKELDEVRDGLVGGIFNEVNELVPIDNLILAVKEEGIDELRFSYHKKVEDKLLLDRISLSYAHQQIIGHDELWYCMPLNVTAGGEEHKVGVLALNWAHPLLHEEDKLLVKLIASYLAVVLYNSIVQVERKYLDIELAQDEARRAVYEENMLHVQNLVLDNCLSTIKHETIYYPNKIRQIAERMLQTTDDERGDDTTQLSDMAELVSYYKDVFTLLASCAARQLDEVTFRRSEVVTDKLVSTIQKYYKKATRKMVSFPIFEIESTDSTLIGDEILLNFLFENLINEALQERIPGKLHLKITTEESFVRFDFTDFRRTYPQEELNALFYPDHTQIIDIDGVRTLKGKEYLVCKQIIREHDEFAGRRGCRINACQTSDGKGFTVWFTIPASKTR